MSEIYKTFVMEIRPRLQSCNVFVNFKNKTHKKTKINLKENEIKIQTNESIDTIPISTFKIISNSLSSLQIDNESISFRFQTQNVNKTSGLFKTELLIYDLNNTNIPTSVESKLVKNTKYRIKCSNCNYYLSDNLSFERVLPLPSEDVEPSEWFCHNHNDDETKISFAPTVKDCFYSKCYFHLNKSNIKYILSASKSILCERCFAWLGLLLQNSNTTQLWFHTVCLQTETTSISSTPFADLQLTIKTAIADSPWIACKFLFQCSAQNNNFEYLSLWILEKNLKLYVKGLDNINDGVITVAKVLFRFDTQVTDMINEWLKDIQVMHLNISKPMMVTGLNHFYEMCRLIPSCFRVSNGFYVSYLSI